MTDGPLFETREEWRAALRPIHERIRANAQAVLKPGDRLRVSRCGGSKIVVTMAGWDGHWITSRTLNDIAPSCIERVNGMPVNFVDEADRATFYSPPPVIEDRLPHVRFSPHDGVIYITAARTKHMACAILPEDVIPLLHDLLAAHRAAERNAANPVTDADDMEVPF